MYRVKTKPISLLFVATALSVAGNIYAEVTPNRPNVDLVQQEGKVSGNVVDKLGPVIGASVVVKGTTNGNITDFDGNFTLEGVKKGDIIQISYIGYSIQEIEYTGQASINVTMVEDAEQLDEVVVTALGMKRTEKALGYAVTELKGEDLKTNAINPISSLQGKVAGVEIAGSDGGMFGATKIQIRGASTLAGNNQPIYVVDGVILSNDLSGDKSSDYDSNPQDYGNMLKNLNPDDFETVSVLKGAAATALYGSRGLNGAVVITTKSGKNATGFGVSVSQTFGIDHAHGGMQRQMVYGPGNYSGNVFYGETRADGKYNIWDNTGQFFLDTKRMLSAVAAVNLSWKNQLFLDITGRNDWSSGLIYTDGSGNYSYFYPSIGGSILFNEIFRDDMPSWINLAKLRASWAQVGNDASAYSIYSYYQLKSLLQPSGNNIFTNGWEDDAMKKIFSPDLKPERKNSWEIGLDLRTFNSRLCLDATYYKENTTDQIMTIDVPYESGMSKQLINAGNIQNSGVEIALNTVPFQNKDWEWTLDFTFTKNTNKIVELHPNVANYIPLQGDVAYGNYRIGSVAMVGGSYGLLMSDAMPKKNEKGETVLTWRDDFRAAYAQRSGTAEVVGSMVPDFMASVSTGITWKDLSLRVALDARVGGKIASYSNRYGQAYGYTEASLDYRDAEHGGITWTSQYADSKGQTFSDGVIPEGVFEEGTKVTCVDGKVRDLSGMSFADAVKAGYVEPVHASTYHYWSNSWGTGTVNDYWVNYLSYIALREITLAYRLPKNLVSKIGAKGITVSFTGRDLGYLYNSLPNNLNPEGIRGNNAAEFRERANSPITSSYMLTLNLDF